MDRIFGKGRENEKQAKREQVLEVIGQAVFLAQNDPATRTWIYFQGGIEGMEDRDNYPSGLFQANDRRVKILNPVGGRSEESPIMFDSKVLPSKEAAQKIADQHGVGVKKNQRRYPGEGLVVEIGDDESGITRLTFWSGISKDSQEDYFVQIEVVGGPEDEVLKSGIEIIRERIAKRRIELVGEMLEDPDNIAEVYRTRATRSPKAALDNLRMTWNRNTAPEICGHKIPCGIPVEAAREIGIDNFWIDTEKFPFFWISGWFNNLAEVQEMVNGPDFPSDKWRVAQHQNRIELFDQEERFRIIAHVLEPVKENGKPMFEVLIVFTPKFALECIEPQVIAADQSLADAVERYERLHDLQNSLKNRIKFEEEHGGLDGYR